MSESQGKKHDVQIVTILEELCEITAYNNVDSMLETRDWAMIWGCSHSRPKGVKGRIDYHTPVKREPYKRSQDFWSTAWIRGAREPIFKIYSLTNLGPIAEFPSGQT